MSFDHHTTDRGGKKTNHLSTNAHITDILKAERCESTLTLLYTSFTVMSGGNLGSEEGEKGKEVE